MRLLVPLFLFLLSIGVYLFLARQNQADIASLQSNLQSVKDELVKVEELQNINKQQRDRYNSIPVKDREDLKKLLPDGIDNVRLFIDIGEMASSYGGRVRNINVTKSSDNSKSTSVASGESDYGSITFSFNVALPFGDFQEFLIDLERSLRLVDFVSISFVSSDSNRYEYNITLQTYWLK